MKYIMNTKNEKKNPENTSGPPNKNTQIIWNSKTKTHKIHEEHQNEKKHKIHEEHQRE